MDKGSIRRDIKWNAKRMMGGNYGAMIGIMFINLGVSVAIAMVINAISMAMLGGNAYLMQDVYYYGSANEIFWAMMRIWSGVMMSAVLTLAVSLFITMPLTFGILDWYRELSLGNRQSVGAIFNYFSSGSLYGRALKVSISYTVKLLLWMLLVDAAYFFLSFGCISLAYWAEVRGGAGLGAIAILLTVVLSVLMILAMLLIVARYTLTIYTSIRNKDWKNREVFRVSTGYMKGHYWETIGYELSFLPWYLLMILTCGILVIYVAPYKMSADILYYNYLYETGEAEKNHTALPYSGVAGTAAFGVAPPEIPANPWQAPVEPEMQKPESDAFPETPDEESSEQENREDQ